MSAPKNDSLPADTIPACLIVDDFPLNATYWWRAQQAAFGYDVPRGGAWAKDWPAQAKTPFMPMDLTRQFADLVDEFKLQGKFTMLPCPGGFGRIDQRVRGLSDSDLKETLDIVRDRIAPSFDMALEVLTHTMALVPESGALLPHSESEWVSYLAANRKMEELQAYLRFGWSILRNVGLTVKGVTIGGMRNASNIGQGRSLLMLKGDARKALGEAMLAVEREFNASNAGLFMQVGGEHSVFPKTMQDVVCQAADGRQIFCIHYICEPLLNLLYGVGDPMSEIELLISSDLERGRFVSHIESGKALVILVHAQTMTSLNTGLGLKMLREIVRRIHARYGKRLTWMSPSKLFAFGNTLAR